MQGAPMDNSREGTPKETWKTVQEHQDYRDPLEEQKERDPDIERLTPLTNRQDQLPGKKDL